MSFIQLYCNNIVI